MINDKINEMKLGIMQKIQPNKTKKETKYPKKGI